MVAVPAGSGLLYWGCRVTAVVLMFLRSSPGADQRVDYRLLAVIGLVHRGGDVGRGELDADVGGQGVRHALDLP